MKLFARNQSLISSVFFHFSISSKYLAKVDSRSRLNYRPMERKERRFGAPAGDQLPILFEASRIMRCVRQIERGRDTQSATPRYATRMKRKQEERTPVPRPLSTLRVRFGQRARYVNVTSLRNVISIELVD